jgi:hypothetical protein
MSFKRDRISQILSPIPRAQIESFVRDAESKGRIPVLFRAALSGIRPFQDLGHVLDGILATVENRKHRQRKVSASGA